MSKIVNNSDKPIDIKQMMDMLKVEIKIENRESDFSSVEGRTHVIYSVMTTFILLFTFPVVIHKCSNCEVCYFAISLEVQK